jgi:hypothetical protein
MFTVSIMTDQNFKDGWSGCSKIAENSCLVLNSSRVPSLFFLEALEEGTGIEEVVGIEEVDGIGEVGGIEEVGGIDEVGGIGEESLAGRLVLVSFFRKMALAKKFAHVHGFYHGLELHQGAIVVLPGSPRRGWWH